MSAWTRRRLGAAAAALAAIAAIAGAIVLARAGDVQKKPAAAQSARVLEFAAADIAQVKRESVPRTMPVTGTLVPLQEAVVKTRGPGVLTAVLAREGESVRKGQLLARVDDTEARAVLAARQADVAAAQAQLGYAQRNLQRQRDLLDKGFISANAFDTVKNEVAVAGARLDAAKAQATQVRKTLADQTLASPISGIVARRHAEPGERLPADAPILTVVSLDRLEVAVDVPTTSIAAVSVGQAVSVRVEGFDGRVFEGRVERINPQATAGAGVVPVYVVVDNPDRALRAGLFAHGELVLAAGAPRLTIPASALQERAGAHFVYAIENGKVALRPVKLAFLAGSRAVLAEGLSEGAIVVAANLGALPEGAQARLPAPAGKS